MFRMLPLIVLVGCTGTIDPIAAGDPDRPDAGTIAPGDPDARPTDPGDPDAAPPVDDDARDLVCARWRSDRQGLQEGSWNGDVATCDAGTVSAPGIDNTVKLVNLYRWLVGLPPVTNDPALDAQAQQCALMMRANNALSHQPPTTWACYTSEGATAASRSNISSGPTVSSVDAYMADNFAPNSLGHRRWILSNSLGRIGVGSTNRHSCLWVIGGGGSGAGQAWTAFPPPGPFPYEAVKPFLYSIDSAGWSIQSDSISLAGAEVSITAGGEPRPVEVVALPAGYGSGSAIAMVPQGWQTEPNTVYHVEVTGIGTPIRYDVDVVDCETR